MPPGDPSGLGVYVRGITQRYHGTPQAAAQKAARYGVRWVSVAVCAQSRRTHRDINGAGADSVLARYAASFAAEGVDVWLVGMPTAGKEQRFVERLRAATDDCGRGVVKGWLLDPEIGYKWGRRMGRSEVTARDSAQNLIDLALDAMDESLGIGVTSYGAAHWHHNFPWLEFGGLGWGSPQTYTADEELVEQCMSAWRQAGWEHLYPSTAAYGPNTESRGRFDEYMAAHGHMDAFCVWSWRQMSAPEWNAYKDWGEKVRGC